MQRRPKGSDFLLEVGVPRCGLEDLNQGSSIEQ